MSAVLLVCSLLGVLLGAALIGRWCVGVALMGESVAVAVFALLRDAEGRAGGVHAVPAQGGTVTDILKRAARAS